MKPQSSAPLGVESLAAPSLPDTGHTARNLVDASVVLLVVFALAVVLFGLAFLLRRRLRRLRRVPRTARAPGTDLSARAHAAPAPPRHRRRRSRRMNPTRAQVGGLPPKRETPPLGSAAP